MFKVYNISFILANVRRTWLIGLFFWTLAGAAQVPGRLRGPSALDQRSPRQRLNIDAGWRFFRYTGEPDSLIYRVSSIWPDSKRTGIICISPVGAPIFPWRISFRIGPGRTG